MNYNIRQSKVRKDAVKAGYRSGFEQSIGEELKKNKIPFEYETKTFDYYLEQRACRCSECGSTKIIKKHSYKPDFIVGNTIIEAKGRLTAKDKKKMIAVAKYNPDINIVFLFQNGNRKLTRKSKKTYEQWASDNGFDVIVFTDLKNL
jgi:ssDNA-binding Zn-finger/Zn-ribbon topoisomerase 1